MIALLIFVVSQIKMRIFSGKKKETDEKSKQVGNPLQRHSARSGGRLLDNYVTNQNTLATALPYE